MNNLRLNVAVPTLALLTPVGTNTYMVAVEFLNSSGAPLGSPYIPNTYTATVVTTGPSFPVNVPIQDGTYSHNNVTIKVYPGSVENCCFGQGVFNISNTASGGGNQEIQARLMDYGYEGHLDMEWSGSSKNWVGRDLSTVLIPSGYKLHYYDGGRVIVRDTPLDNYIWPSNDMITIQKCIVKDGVEDLYFWGLNGNDPLRRPDDGFMMSENTSVAYQTWIFNAISNAQP